MKETPTIHASRLTLRAFFESDYEDVYEWCSSLETTKYLFWYPFRSIDDAKRIVNSWVRKKRNYSFAVCLGQKVIGEVEVIKDLPNQGFELGFTSNLAYSGQGYFSEACKAIIDYLFVHDGYQYAYAETDERNEKAIHLLTRLGFVLLEEKAEPYFISKKNITIQIKKFILKKAQN
jgi:ribosomal-protein-alanine N-acetyltransferase